MDGGEDEPLNSDAEELTLPEGVAVGEGTALDVILALTPKEIVESGVSDDDDVRLSVIDGVERGVDERLSLPDVVAEGVGTALDVILALPPKEIVEGGVADDEDVRLAVGVIVLETVAESELVSALDGVCEDEGVCVNVDDDEGVRVTELVSEDDKLEEIDAVTLGETVLLGVEETDAPRVTEVVGVFDTEELKLGVDDVDGINVLVSEPEPVGVSLGEAVIKGVGVPDSEELKLIVVDIDGVGVTLGVGVINGVPDSEDDIVVDIDGVNVIVLGSVAIVEVVAITVVVTRNVAIDDTEWDREPVDVAEHVSTTVTEAVAIVADINAVGVVVAIEEKDAFVVGDGRIEADAVIVATNETVDVALGLCDADAYEVAVFEVMIDMRVAKPAAPVRVAAGPATRTYPDCVAPL